MISRRQRLEVVQAELVHERSRLRAPTSLHADLRVQVADRLVGRAHVRADHRAPASSFGSPRAKQLHDREPQPLLVTSRASAEQDAAADVGRVAGVGEEGRPRGRRGRPA